MRCPKCGNELAPNAAFCNQCGTKLMQQGRADGPTDTLRGRTPGGPGGAPSAGPGGAPVGRQVGGPGGAPSAGPGGNPSGVLQGGPMPGSGVLQGGPSGGRVGGGTPIGPSRKKKSMVVPIVISSIVLVALIATIVIILLKKNSDDKKTASGDTETATEASVDDKNKDKDNSGKDKTTDKTEADTQENLKEEKKSAKRVASKDIKLYEIVDGVFFFEGRLFGMSYNDVKDYVYSLGYKYAWDEETEWKYGSEDNITVNRIDIDNNILGLYFQNHMLIGVTYEQPKVGAISKDIIDTANMAYGTVTMLSHDNKNKPYEIFCKYSNKNVNVGDTEEGGSYSAFLNPYDDIEHLDQQYLSNRFDGEYINPNFVIVRTKELN